MEKYQSYMQYELEKSRRRITALVDASLVNEQDLVEQHTDHQVSDDEIEPQPAQPFRKRNRTGSRTTLRAKTDAVEPG